MADRPRALVICFFPAFMPASAGGELRLSGIYRALSAHMDVTMLTSTNFGARREEIHHTATFREIRFPKDEFWSKAYATLEASGISGDLSGMAFALAVSNPLCELRQTARSLAASADVVFHEFPFSEPIFADGSCDKEVYHSHNFEAGLLASVVDGKGLDDSLLKLIRLEANLCRRAKRVFATSQQDAERFRLFHGVDAQRLSVSPNGYDPTDLDVVVSARRGRQPSARPQLLFTGSGHQPNVEAAAFLIEMASDLPDCDIVIAGGVCASVGSLPAPDNLRLFGPFDAAERQRLLIDADIYLNPVLTGSGTSLKAIEALGAMVPMVATAEGVRGLGLESGNHAIIAPRSEFVDAIRRLLADPEEAEAIARQGRDYAQAAFAWSSIARYVTNLVLEPPAANVSHAARPLLICLNDYHVIGVYSGGASRMVNLLQHLDADVVLLTFGDRFDFILLANGLLHVTVMKSAAHVAFERAVNDGHDVTISDGVASLFVAENRVMTSIIGDLLVRASAIDFEHCYMAPVLDYVLSIRPDIPVIYSAHNVEGTLKPGLLRSHPLGSCFAAFIGELEEMLVRRAHLLACCTESDAAHFQNLGARAVVVPNGCAGLPDSAVAVDEATIRAQPGAIVGFLGSAHGPNFEAASFILSELAPAMPDIQFEMIGSVCESLTQPVPANVALLGSLDEASKSRRMSRWAIGLNPLSEGGGASLKVPDYMAHGNAVVSTPVGCRGVPVAEEDCGIVCQLSGFQAAVGSLLASPAVLQRQRHNAAEFASRHLSWSAVSAQYRARLSEIWRAPTRRGQSMLVVTYRYTEPALGGAEEYLIEVLGRMRPHFSRIDLAAVNVGHLTNHHHFASKFSTDHAGGSTRIASLFDRATFAAPDVVPEQVLFDECRELERYWTREQQHLHAPFAMDLLRSAPRHPRLFSGFYWPENHAGVVRRWTSTEFAILIPGNIRVVRLLGWSPVAAEMTVSLTELLADGAATTAFRTARSIEANFSVSIEVLPSSTSQPRLLTFSVGEFRPDGDHRVLGVLLEQVSVLINEATDEPLAILTEYFADIGEEVDLEIRQSYFPRWVRNLRDVAISRSDHAERLFRDVRGPSSVALRTWIAQHAQDYDTVLVQGVPFDVLPSTVEALTGLPRRPRLVVLPHFHGDDRFYYWRQYLDAFNAADATLMFSSSLSQVVDAGSAVVVPGGGVRLDEIADPAARHHFESVYPKRRPFFLVLGRKTPSKGYRVAVDAYALARDAGLECDLVLIGPDEDGLPIDEQGVTYLGRQPRDVVRGALASCVGLINMSSSESFGIVLCEAWLFGKPVIANRACYSFRDLVKDGQTGLLAGDVHELGAAMQMLAHNPGLTARLGEAGFLDAVTNYSWWSVANAVSKVIIG